MTAARQTTETGAFDEVAEAELWRAFKQQGSAAAREALFDLHLAFAQQIARKHFLDRRGGGIELAELQQLASLGLIEALDGFDPERAVPFRGYARKRISGAILDGLSKLSEAREQASLRNRARRDRVSSLSPTPAAEGRNALDELIELATGLAIGFMLEDTSLFVDEEQPARQPSAYDSLAWKQTAGRMLKEVERLPERERAIIRRHYLAGMPFEEVADLMGLTKGRVSQIHRAALALLRKRLANARDFRLER
ncbi:hypothetical protein AS593_07570 [Caulobacter vibrioides]|nr:hypothetical protein AS593_07570 [Caulobacter vibrioides]